MKLIEVIEKIELEEGLIQSEREEDITQEQERELHRNFEKIIREIEGIFGNDRIFEGILITDPRCEGLTKPECDELLSRATARNYLRILKEMIASRQIDTLQKAIDCLSNIQRNIHEKPALLISQLQRDTLTQYIIENH